jgi:hypothetical protein
MIVGRDFIDFLLKARNLGNAFVKQLSIGSAQEKLNAPVIVITDMLCSGG